MRRIIEFLRAPARLEKSLAGWSASVEAEQQAQQELAELCQAIAKSAKFAPMERV